jgi:hypothetical protein
MDSNEAASRATEERERRKGVKPVPDHIYATLNEVQRLTLSRLESFGYSIRFVRRFNVGKPLVIVGDASGKSYAILDEDGNLDKSTPLTIR